ncbi:MULTISPECIES: GH3 auxin-responsive promoter family protein [unclassified Leptolyngbya]|uniref:GH3 auxin-responsive promoter family protein n=1 Tax=unclassified Leptolyngbya TaxID=2650499 RepID=UPI0016836AA7|nr:MULTISPECIES: GH3 auxin-responsive promoter family protein [unclassified Leptolyngbya]MBD1911366.1 GH3 auxin-responsive promoter family protein [Leptolyngbya sp. FACHB-8]MBD2156616.1 GH3 auxin-responsive promoter family protein [Leptolyngbya sp. FACHB-16]
MANLLLSLIAEAALQARRDFIAKTYQTEAVQVKFLRSLLHANQETVLGQHHSFAKLQSVQDFRDAVPVSRYSDYESYIQRAFQGEANVMTPDPAIYFNMTSGSTGKQKLIPVTRRSRRAVSYANQVAVGFGTHAARRDRRPLGKMLFTNSARSFGRSPQGIPYGPISVSDLNLMGPIYQQVFAHPFEVMKAGDSVTRNYLCLLFALTDPNLRIVSATFPVYALTFCEHLEIHAESLIEDLETGTFAPWLKLEPELREVLERQWRPHPRRAAELRHILNAEGRLVPHRAWPNLAFIVTARGGTSNFYINRFKDYFADTPVFGGTYSSAEATYGVHRDFGTDGVILAVNSGFYEFVPESEWEAEQPKTLLPHEVTVGDRYRILISNLNGFYRYDIGDVVEVEGFYNTAPIFVFRHRRGGLLSSTTEKTTEFHAIQTMQTLQREFGIALENFCITLSDPEIPPRYQVNIELAPGSTLEDPTKFIHRFDEVLAELHASYALRRPEPIPDPRLRILAPGSFNQIRQRMIDRGVLESQIKFPHLSDDRHYLEGLTVMEEVTF